MYRVNGDWLHWNIGQSHFGYHRHGRCWSFIPSVTKYTNSTFYSWWRFFVAIGR